MGFSVWFVMTGLLLIGMAAGFLMHRSDFCMAGAFRDVFLFRSCRLIRPIVLLVVVSALLFELFHRAHLLPGYPFPSFSPPAGANLFGGLLFGVGMLMSGGCVVGVLYKMGSGNFLALVAFLGLLAGSGLYAEIHAWWAPLARMTTFPTSAITLPQLLGGTTTLPVFLGIAVGGFFCWRWLRKGYWVNHNAAEGYIPLWITACGLATLGVLTVLLCGAPMGVTTSYAKAAAVLESWLVPEHLAALPYFSETPLTFALPYDGISRSGGAGPQFDIVAVIQVPLIMGIIGGSWLSATLLGEFRTIWKVPYPQVVMVFSGGAIMALGSRMSPGCNVWHLWGGLPLLTMQSLLFVLGLCPGAWLGCRILQWVLTLAGQEGEWSHEDGQHGYPGTDLSVEPAARIARSQPAASSAAGRRALHGDIDG